ncbi:MAG: secretin N-terminal domain-containing protein [Terracidiphilus sp.]
MEWSRIAAGRCGMAAAAALALAFALAPHAGAQTTPDTSKPCDAKPAQPAAPETVQTFFLTNASEQNDLNEIQTDLRNALPRARLFGVQSQNAITVSATAEEMETARKLIAELDRPRQLYRLTFTITDLDGGKRVGSQQFVLLAVVGQKSNFKQGNRVPIVTGSASGDPKDGTQVQYQDVGLSIETLVSGSPEGPTLRARVEQSSLAEEKSAATSQDPVVHQTILNETAEVTLGKPMVLGSLDVPGTTRRQEIAVTAELVR